MTDVTSSCPNVVAILKADTCFSVQCIANNTIIIKAYVYSADIHITQYEPGGLMKRNCVLFIKELKSCPPCNVRISRQKAILLFCWMINDQSATDLECKTQILVTSSVSELCIAAKMETRRKKPCNVQVKHVRRVAVRGDIRHLITCNYVQIAEIAQPTSINRASSQI